MTTLPTLEQLRQHLHALVPAAEFEVLEDDNVLIYSLNGIFAGFSIGSGEISGTYEKAYQSFKDAFSAQSSSALEPSFVLCANAELVDIEKLSSSIETDVYFCRKYVLPFSGSLERMLGQLPFLPLNAIDHTGSRPETAQTFLQLNGMPTDLARHIVTPAQRSPEAIVDLCLQGRYGEVKSTDGTLRQRSIGGTAIGGPAIKVDSIAIEGFRAYKDHAEIQLGQNVTFLYGPNGFGKTSLFDAFDFALTGGIGRLGTDNRGTELRNLATHFDTGIGSSKVSLILYSDGRKLEIEREVKDAKSATVNGVKTDRKTLLSRVTGASIPSADRIENLVSLFRATHLFSQEHQELTKDMQTKSELSADIVSRMLAMEDYATAAAKLSGVIAEIEKRQRLLTNDSESAAARIREAERTMSDLDVEAGKVLPVDISSMILPLVDQAGVMGVIAKAQESPVATLRALRTSVEYLLGQLDQREESLTTLRSQASSRSAIALQIATLKEPVRAFSETALTLRETKLRAEAAKSAADRAIAASIERERLLSRDRSKLTWALAHAGPYQDLIRRIRDIEALLPASAASVQAHAQAAQEAQTSLTAAEVFLQSKRTELAAAEAQHVGAKQLSDQVTSYDTLVATCTRQRSEVSRLKSEMKVLEPLIAVAQADLTDSKSTCSSLLQQLDTRDQARSELLSLVEQLRLHVHDGDCPFCGHDHGTKDVLLQTLLRYEELDPNAELRDALRRARELELERGRKLARLRNEEEELVATLRRAQTDLGNSEEELVRLDTLCAEHGLTLGEGRTVLQAAQSYSQVHALQLEAAREQLSVAQQSLTDQRERFEGRKSRLSQERIKYESDEQRLNELKRDLANIERNDSFVSSDLLMSAEDLAKKLARIDDSRLEVANLLSSEREALQLAEKALKDATDQDSAALQRNALLTDQLNELVKALGALDQSITTAGLSLEDPVAAIDSALASLSAQQAEAKTLLGNLTSAEVAADAATTSAALNSYRAIVEEQRKALESASHKIQRQKSWLSYFTEIDSKLKEQRNEAVTSFTTRYGPRTSVIQKRLRAVYGFEEVSITSVDSRISVSVTRQGKQLRPTDYFSQSQQQTLLLGLFLAACSSQTWSGFGPVLLDDPVAHFDDLNTYAFLDLVRGLLQDSGRQFVISTCDERFMQMAIRKFRPFGDRAKFYRFQSIGADGPDIVELRDTYA